MTDDQRQRLAAAVREPLLIVCYEVQDQQHKRTDPAFLHCVETMMSAITPVIDAMLSERDERWEEQWNKCEDLFLDNTSKLAARIAELEKALDHIKQGIVVKLLAAGRDEKVTAAFHGLVPYIERTLNGEPNDG